MVRLFTILPHFLANLAADALAGALGPAVVNALGTQAVVLRDLNKVRIVQPGAVVKVLAPCQAE